MVETSLETFKDRKLEQSRSKGSAALPEHSPSSPSRIDWREEEKTRYDFEKTRQNTHNRYSPTDAARRSNRERAAAWCLRRERRHLFVERFFSHGKKGEEGDGKKKKKKKRHRTKMYTLKTNESIFSKEKFEKRRKPKSVVAKSSPSSRKRRSRALSPTTESERTHSFCVFQSRAGAGGLARRLRRATRPVENTRPKARPPNNLAPSSRVRSRTASEHCPQSPSRPRRRNRE